MKNITPQLFEYMFYNTFVFPHCKDEKGNNFISSQANFDYEEFCLYHRERFEDDEDSCKFILEMINNFKMEEDVNRFDKRILECIRNEYEKARF